MTEEIVMSQLTIMCGGGGSCLMGAAEPNNQTTRSSFPLFPSLYHACAMGSTKEPILLLAARNQTGYGYTLFIPSIPLSKSF